MKLSENTRMVPRSYFLLIGAVMAWSLFADAGQAQGLIIDHRCTDISQVPATWIQQAKTQFRIGYGHTSHGSQLVTGIATLYSRLGIPYDYTYSSSGLVVGKFLNDYWAPGDLGAAGSLTWRDETIEMLNLPGNDRNVVMWSWCGGVSGNTAAGINVYLQAMNELEQMWPDITFIYMTGHLDGTGVNGNLNQMNELIRQFCRANNKTLFDFADIESYDPDGNEFLSRHADDGCNYTGGNWATAWRAAHPNDPLCADCNCAHSNPLNCNLKGRAFWWMMARLAGWMDTDPDPDPVIGPVIKANGSTDNISINRSDNLSITVQLDPGQFAGVEVDWWIIIGAGSSWFYLDSAVGWTQAGVLRPVYQGPLGNLPPTEVFNITGLGTGLYMFFFAIDLPVDGILNFPDGPIVIDAVNVTVQ